MYPPSFQVLLSTGIPSDLSTVVLPNVTLWHPLVQFPMQCHSLQVCPNEECTGILKLHVWAIGQSKGIQPRLIHHVDSTILLVGAIYKCSSGHTIYSTDPRLLRRLDSVQVPFVLLHRSGFTRAFIHSVVSLAKEGLPIKAIARHLQSVREEYAAELLHHLIADYKACTRQELSQSQILAVSTSNTLVLIKQPFPTNDIIARCFIIKFEEKEEFYSTHMMK